MSLLENLASDSPSEIETAAGTGSRNDNGHGPESTPRPKSEEHSTIHELVESLEQILFLISADWNRAYYVSPAFERVTGYTLRHRSRTTCEAGRGWSIPTIGTSSAKPWATGRRVGTAAGSKWSTASSRPAARSAGCARCLADQGEEGEFDRLVGMAEDITERKLAEIELKRSEAELAQKVQMRTAELSRTVGNLEREIEQRKQVEAELERTSLRFRRLFEANIIGVLFTDIHGNIHDANDAFLEMTGYSRADFPFAGTR